VTAACVLLSRTRGLAIAAVCITLYTGIVVARTVLPLIQFFDAPQETTALELVTMFLNAATLLVVAILAGVSASSIGPPGRSWRRGRRISVTCGRSRISSSSRSEPD